MKLITITLFLLFFIHNIGYSQSIIFSKDSLIIEGEGFYKDIKDSLFIKNSGFTDLVIDSIYTNKGYAYPVNVSTKDTSYQFYIIFDQQLSPLVITPQDSIKLIFYIPDLCPICEGYSVTNFQDTLYFRSNSLNAPTYSIYITGQGFTDVKENEKYPEEYSLKQNYPNPFNPSTTIKYSISQNVKREMSNVKLIIYNVLGREVATLVNEKQSAGNYELEFDGSNISSGVYFYQLKIGENIFTKKMLLIK